jgi:ABC-2 type transport system ATP-binding protein
MKDALVQIDGVTKKYDSLTAVDNLSLTIDKGEVFALVGPNGAGKTTLIKMMVCLLKPDTGSIVVDGIDVDKNPLEAKGIIGFLPENISLYGNLTAGENLRFFGDLNGGVSHSAIEESLATAGLSDVVDKRVNEFSKGMKQRLGLACMLVKKPSVLFLDEPTSGLDPSGKIYIQKLLRDLSKKGMTIFFSSHILGEVFKVADRVGFINKAKLEHVGAVASLEHLEDLYLKITGDYVE